jgi:hypothetical protein
LEAVAADADAVADRPVVALHEIEEALGRRLIPLTQVSLDVVC